MSDSDKKYSEADGRDLLCERAKRLVKFLEMPCKVPASIIALELTLVHDAAYLALPQEMGVAWAARIRGYSLGSIGVCSDCLQPMPHEMHACQSCIMKGGEDGEAPR